MAFAGGSIRNMSVTSAVWSPGFVETAVEVAGAGVLAIFPKLEVSSGNHEWRGSFFANRL